MVDPAHRLALSQEMAKICCNRVLALTIFHFRRSAKQQRDALVARDAVVEAGEAAQHIADRAKSAVTSRQRLRCDGFCRARALRLLHSW